MSQATTKKRKAESSTPAPAPAAPATSTPSASHPYSAPQGSRTPTPGWNGHSSQIPIDPALQQPQQQQQQQQPQTTPQPQPQQPQPPQQPPQHHPLPTPAQQQQYANYYQQYNYAAAGYHPPPAWSAAQARAVQQPQQQQSQQPQPQQQQQSGGDLDTADVATLNDAIGSAGVDLRAEEENLRQSHAQSHTQTSQPRGPQRNRGRKQSAKPTFDVSHLGTRVRDVARRHALPSGVPEDSVTYLALALRMRLSGLIEGMVAAAAHREETGVSRPAGLYADGTPMWTQVVRRDVAKQLALLERVEREEELAARRERKARDAYAAGGQAALPSLDDALPMEAEEEPKKKKKKPDGPGVTAKNMSEDMKKKLSNAVAAQAAGLGTGKYAWMNAGNIPSGPPVKKAAGTPTPPQQSSSGWSKPFQSGKKKDETPVDEDNRRAITLRDAIFVVERERGHGGGRGAARGWT